MKTVPSVLIALSLLLCLAGNAPAKETVKIGLITPLTGDVKTFGESVKNAFNMAVEEYAQKGKYNIQAILADDRNDATEGAAVALKIITRDRVAAIVGPVTSKVAIPVSEIASQHNIPMISAAATNPGVTTSGGKRKPCIFRACFIDPFQGVVVANFALKDLGAKTAAILYDIDNDYSKGLGEYFKDTFSKGNGAIVAFESYRKDSVDFSALIMKIAAKRPDVIFIPDYYNKVALISKQIRENGIMSTLLGGDGWDSPELLKMGGDSVVGGYFANHYSADRRDPVAESFINKYKARHGIVPDAFAALAYDATAILLKALDCAKRPLPEDIMKTLAMTKGHKGVTGLISFDANGDALKSVVILKVEKNGFKYVKTVDP